MSLIHLFMNNPTAGTVDGTEISSGTEVLPLTLTLDASKAESKVAKCAVRCDSGYSIEGAAAIYFEGTNADKWQIAQDNDFADSDTALSDGDWQSGVSITEVTDTNTIFWVKATSSNDESPQNDRTVDLKAEGLVVFAED